MPSDISEQSEINGWILSKRNRDAGITIDDKLARGIRKVDFARGLKSPLSKTAAKTVIAMSSSSGSPLVRENYIEIEISDGNDSHGSNASHIYLHFGDSHRLQLNGRSTTKFQRGDTLRWDFNSAQNFVESVPTDNWDNLTLETPFNDGIKIARVEVVHSGEKIVDWHELVWLDDSTDERHQYISLTAQMLQTKLDMIDHNWIAQIHWAAKEIGKSDPVKYGTTNAWCSEFASWALRKGKWDTPTGNIGSQAMENYFAGIGRAHQVSEILNGSYTLNPGDYLRFQWASGGQHSGIFIDYRDDPSNLTVDTRLNTIEGNTSSTVRVRTSRTLGDVISCGNTR